MEHSASFGAWLQRRRKALDLTQEALAQRVACSVATIRKIEADQRRPSRQIAELLTNVLQIPTNERDKFIEVARAQLRTERLENIAAPLPEVVFSASTAMPSPPLLRNGEPPNPTQPFNFPIPSTPLIGRENELATIEQLLANPECRLLTIVGPGGMGKTRLALAVAASQQANVAQGVAFVSFAGVASPEFIVPTIANALGLTFSSSTEPKQQLLHHVRQQQLLLVLDNLEHLLDGVEMLSELLANSPGLKVLVTSRERLNLQGEWVFDLQGLPIPPDHQVQQLMDYSTVALFVERAQRVSTTFALTPQNQTAIVRICRLVEGMPLGIELAAAWVHLLSCQEIAQEIERSIDFLAVSRRDLPERHRSLRATFDHSWHLLSDAERHLLCRLVVFQDGFTREAATRAVGATLPLLSSLITKSLLRRRADGRYDLHELIRQYTQEKLRTAGQWEATYDQHLAYFLHFAQEGREQLRGAQLTEWYQRLEKEHANFRAALEWAFAVNSPPERIAQGIRLAAANHRYWQGRGHLREGFDWLDRGLGRAGAIDPATRAEALQIAGWLVNQLGAKERAVALLQESIGLFKQLQDEINAAAALDFLGDVAWSNGDFGAAQRSYAESLAIFRRCGDGYMVGFSLYSAGRLHVDYGEYAAAQRFLAEGLRVLEAIPHARGIALCQNGLGRLALFQEQWGQATLHLHKAIQIFHELGNKVDIAECLEGFALLALTANQSKQAIRLWSAASDLRERLGVALGVHDPIYQKVAATDLPKHVATNSAPKVESMTADELADFVKIG